MGKPVNLNRFRKNKARADAKVRADQNAAKHGLTKAVKELEKARAEKAARSLDQLKRDGE
ncbi:hypothetical protein PEL8287_03411 [Roseovarius litorisediminis]|uniref:Uncharacterized protein n=1 Tax=Roseovarius litorisediminis TaxID=1312363 RepID=A0A1Y5TFA0_9RHOB|nr:DUF4169 family protein [Roseovarius litorisediminis]SLN62510.1 hypothetical protein PEL8287_03411 [Roseovarius litorisediminis]